MVPHYSSRTQQEDDVGVRLEPHGTMQRLHSSWFLHTSKQQLQQLGGVPGERGALLQLIYLQQTLLCQRGMPEYNLDPGPFRSGTKCLLYLMGFSNI